jgi:hypothetical protein
LNYLKKIWRGCAPLAHMDQPLLKNISAQCNFEKKWAELFGQNEYGRN